MVEANGSEDILNVPVEATAFLAAVSAFAVFLLVIFVYANKKWRILNVGVDGPTKTLQPIQNKSQLATQKGDNLTIHRSYESSDSEEELLRRLRLQTCRELNAVAHHEGASSAILRESSTHLYSEPHSNYQSQHHHQEHGQQHHGNHGNHGMSEQLSRGGGAGSEFQSPSSHSTQSHSVLHHHHHNLHHQLSHHRSIDLDSNYISLSNNSENPHVPSVGIISNSGALMSSGATTSSGGVGGTIGVGAQLATGSSTTIQHHNPPHFSRSDSISGYSYGNSSSNRATPSMSPPHATESPRSYHSLGHSSTRNACQSSQNVRPLRVSSIRDTDACSRRRPHPRGLTRTKQGRSVRGDGNDSNDLISLAEKGKVNGGSSASSTSSNVSADDDHHPLRATLSHSNPSTNSSQPNTITSRQNSLNGTDPHHRRLHHHHPLIAAHSTTSSGGECRRVMIPPRTKSVDSESPPPSEQGLSTYGDSIDQDDHIFEVEEMMEEGDLSLSLDARVPSSPVQCGSLEVAFDYEAVAKKMTVHIIQARGVPPKDMGGANHTQVRVVLLPSRKQKHKTKVRPGQNPTFMESFVFNKINPEEVSSLGIRFRLYGCERIRRERLLGETILSFGSIHLELDTTVWINLEPRYHLKWDSRSESGSLARSDSASSTASIQNGIPELLVGLAYNGTTGRLTVEVIKGSHFRNLAGGRAPDSYVKLVLVSCSGQEMGRAKSSLRRAQSNPLFKETFMFQVALFQVSEVTLLVSIYGRKGVTRRELLGWFALGYNSSGDEETTHWEDMCDAQGDQMCRWHVLLQS